MGNVKLYLFALILIFLMLCSAVQATEKGNVLTIEGSCGWTKHVEVPQGALVQLVTLAEKDGVGFLNEINPDGTISSQSHYFLSYDKLPFYANEPGRHVLSYNVCGLESNTVTVDVIGTHISPTYLPVAPPGPVQNSIDDYMTYASKSLSLAIPSLIDIRPNPIITKKILRVGHPPQYYFGMGFST